MSDDTEAARDAITELATTTTWLAVSLLPGTAKPYRIPALSEDKRIKRDLEDRAYRDLAIASGSVPLGESPAPMDLNVLDLLSEILTVADELAEQVASTVKCTPMRPAVSAFADPGPFFTFALAHLAAAVATDDTLSRFIEGKCDDLTMRAHTALGLLGDGQELDVVCPWCDGRSGGRRGQRTMRVRAVLPQGKRSVISVKPSEVRWMVVCYGANCTPAADEVGEWWRDRPAWPLATWATWLADRLGAASMAS